MSEKENLETELSILTETLEEKTKEFNSSFETTTKALAEELEKMRKYNIMLQSVPTKLNKQLEETIPKVAVELDLLNTKRIEQLESNHTNIVEEHHSSLMQTESKIQEILKDIYKIERRRLYRFFFVILMATSVASGVAAYTANYVTDKYLRRVQITNPNQVILQDSDVTVMDMPHHKVYQQQDRKKKKN